MGTLNFFLPAPADEAWLQALAKSYVLGGIEYMPWFTEARVTPSQLTVQTPINESGCVCVPWPILGRGYVMITTATVMNTPAPYRLALELARGKVNHLRWQIADWEAGGLVVSPDLESKLRAASQSFAHAVCQQGQPGQGDAQAGQTIALAVEVGEELVHSYVEQVFAARMQRQAPLDTSLSCRIHGTPPNAEQTAILQRTFDTVQIPFSWPAIERTESEYTWEASDALVEWAKAAGFQIVGGPLVDFSAGGLPSWLGQWHDDLRRITNFMDDYIEIALQRYSKDIRTWQLIGASNWPSVLSLGKDDLLHLTHRLLYTARQVNPDIALILGIAQPWGEYLTREDRAFFPLVFTDMLLRNRASIASLDLEIVMGAGSRSSYSRDAIETSRLLDLYALLGLPIRVTLACPSALTPDAQADPTYLVEPRGDAEEWSPEVQHRWMERFVPLAMCKPYVECVTWCHFSDAQPHQFPNCGLADSSGQVKPGLEVIKGLRRRFLDCP